MALLLRNPIAGTSCELAMPVLGSCLEAVHHKVHEPLNPTAIDPADPVQGDFLPHQACHEDALLLSNGALLSVQDKLPATVLALMVLLAGVHMPVSLEMCRNGAGGN